MTLAPLPPRLADTAFVVPDSELARSRTRANDLWTPTRGTRLPCAMTELEHVCAAHDLTLPLRSAFSHATAARLWQLPLPWFVDETVHITVSRGIRAPRRRGVIGHQRQLPAGDVVEVNGIRLTSPARTFVDLAAVLDLVSLVAIGDCIVSRRAPLADEQALRQRVERASARRGIIAAREAIALLDPGAESPKETELRFLLQRAGLGPLVANPHVYDENGRWIARVDLAISALKIAIEYEGDHHRDKAQWRRDVARRRRLEAAGWIYIAVTQADLASPGALLNDVAAAIRSRR